MSSPLRTKRPTTGQYALRTCLALATVLYVFTLVRTAWLCDDAYITFRTIDNFVSGYGLTWNVHERVQAYTHPLWMFLLSGFYYFTHEIYFTSLFVSMAVSLAAVLAFASRIARSWQQAILGLVILTFSKAFVDFSTSGLENPLSYLLLAVFFSVYLQDRPVTGKRLLGLSLIASLGVLNRMDTLLLFGPALMEAWWRGGTRGLSHSEDSMAAHNAAMAPGVLLVSQGPVIVFGARKGARAVSAKSPATATTAGPGSCHPPPLPFHLVSRCRGGLLNPEPRTLNPAVSPCHRISRCGRFTLSPCHLVTLSAVLGFLPFLAWEAFSLIYYGFPFPNTAYAKLNTGIPAMDLALQGLYYLLNSMAMDPLTLTAILTAVTTAFILRQRKEMMIAAGILLYLAYVVRIGGDFMTGRFLAVPLFCAAAILGAIPWQPRAQSLVILLVVAVGLGFCSPTATVCSGYDFGQEHATRLELPRKVSRNRLASPHKIADERATCYRYTGLLRVCRFPHRPDHPWVQEAIDLRQSGQKVVSYSGIGFRGYFAGPDLRIIDLLALADPLLARMPPEANPRWRIGHFRRAVPEGYPETLASGHNCLKDRDLATFYDKLALITQGPLFTRQRWAAIWNMNRGRYEHLIDADTYRFPGQVHTDLRQLADLSPPPAGSPNTAASQAAPGATGGLPASAVVFETAPNSSNTAASQAAPAAHPAMVKFARSGILVHLGMTYSPSVILTLTSNSGYQVTWLRGKRELGKAMTASLKNANADLVPIRLSAPDAAIRKGYDALRIQPARGATEYGLSQVRLYGGGKP